MKSRSIRFALAITTILLTGSAGIGQKSSGPYDYYIRAQALANGEKSPDRCIPKQQKRALHYLESHLSPEGKVINHIARNMQELQQLYVDTLGGNLLGEWNPMGPYSIEEDEADGEGTGRVNCLAFATASRWYAGTAGGGLWKTEQSGIYIPGQPFPWE
ncbi:MAG: hypothetical protein R3330_10240, partial [Saprospiraceae bacterium]|nr:hypothetical protein [Saprospiraceae bacterium]